MATLESQLSQQVVGSLAADILAPEPVVLGLIEATQFVDGLTPKGKTRITLNWTAPTKNEAIGGELLKNPDDTPSLAEGSAGASHEAQFDPITAGSFTAYERTAASASPTTLSASVIPKSTGRVSFDDSADNVANRVPEATASFPQDGETFSYKIETEDTVTFWTDGTSNIPPPADTSASKTAGAGDGTGGR